MESTGDVILGIDIGTTACKAVALRGDGSIVAKGDGEYPLLSPEPGAAEQALEDIFRGVSSAIEGALAGIASQKLMAVSFSGAMHSLVAVQEDGTPLGHAVTWADNRSGDEAAALRENSHYARTGCPVAAMYHPARLRWLKHHAPEHFAKADRFVAIKDWIIHRLTGRWATDVSLASSTGLLDIHTQQWHGPSLELAGIGREKLADLVAMTAAAGQVRGSQPLPEGLPIIAGGSDGAMANIGAGSGNPGRTVITIGTSGAIRTVMARPHMDARERTWCYALSPDRYLVGGAINNGGLVVKWVRDRFYPEAGGEAGYQAMMRDADVIGPGSDGVMMLPYLAGERSPHWSPDATAAIVGMSLHHTRAHVARAAAESVAYCLADVWQAINLPRHDDQPVRLTGGITRFPTWAQIVADVLNVPLLPVDAADASALGAAVTGHAAFGMNVTPTQTTGNTIAPSAQRHAIHAERLKLFRAMWPMARARQGC